VEDLLYRDTVVIGVGNTILSDDGVGVHAARLLQLDPRVPPGVTILDGGTIGLELVPYASDACRLLLLDAMNSGQAPGTLARMMGRDLLGRTSASSAHQLGVTDLIAAVLLVSRHAQDIVVLGIQPASTDWGTRLSPAVDGALASLVDAAVAQLNVWDEARAGGSTTRPNSFPLGPSSDRAVPEACEQGAR
jgi:hydrogenase maturation protease